jgi:endonuclease/exonuclease/phosphatase family metal-dependent hydrolase
VLRRAGDDAIHAWTEKGKFTLPDDADEVLGAAHPFGPFVADDLVQLCHHRDAGDIVISGFRADGPNLSFPLENGAHAGPGPNETHAFAASPGHTVFEPPSGSPLRPAHLRETGLRILGRTSMPPNSSSYRERAAGSLRVMTYNVHGCVGIDGRRSLERIARVIAMYDPDIVALQELDVGRVRSDHEDQAQEIADMVEMLVHFHPAIAVEEEHYGDAILSKHPMELVQAGELPGLFGWPRLEPRGAMWADITLNGQVFHVFNTHLGLHPWERRLQVNALVGEEWLLNERCAGHRIMCGDFNAGPRSTVCRKIGALLIDSQVAHENHRPKRTFHSRYPVGRIDHVFVEKGTEITHIEIPSTHLTRVASDHLPLIVEFRME